MQMGRLLAAAFVCLVVASCASTEANAQGKGDFTAGILAMACKSKKQLHQSICTAYVRASIISHHLLAKFWGQKKLYCIFDTQKFMDFPNIGRGFASYVSRYPKEAAGNATQGIYRYLIYRYRCRRRPLYLLKTNIGVYLKAKSADYRIATVKYEMRFGDKTACTKTRAAMTKTIVPKLATTALIYWQSRPRMGKVYTRVTSKCSRKR